MPTFKLAVTPAQVAEGAKLFANYCVRCHGSNVVSGGLVPDLRYSTEATHKSFQDIVRGGILREFGMASFAEDLTAEQVKDIEGFILSRAKESAVAEGKR
jgi:mono/diheme cytochrome c family protein